MKRGEVLALWIVLFDHASRAAPRGSVRDIDPEEIAAMLELDPAAVEAALKAFRDKRMILAEGVLGDWEKSQSLSTARARALRNRRTETDAARRQRLQNEMLSRHERHGHILAE